MHEKIIEIGIIGLLIYMPIAFGGAMEGSIALMELVVAFLMLVWVIKFWRSSEVSPSSRISQHSDRRSRIIVSSLFIFLGIFVGLILFQLMPLPASLTGLLSPVAYCLYADASTITGLALPSWLPLTISSHATETELYKILSYCAIFFLVINVIRSPKQIRRIVYVIIAVGLFESFYGMFEYLSGHHHIFFHKKQTSFTVSGTFVNKNHFAGYMQLVIPLAFSVLFRHLAKGSHSISKKLVKFVDEKYMKVILISFLVSLMTVALLLSGSRGGLVGFIAGMLCLLGLTSTRKLLRKRTVSILILLTLAFCGSILIGYELLFKRLQGLVELNTAETLQFRIKIWKDTVPMIRDFPLLGSGLGTFSHIFPRYQSFPSDIAIKYAENDYLQVLFETGVIGFALITGAVCLFFYSTLKSWKQQHSRWSVIVTACGISGMVSLLVHSTVDFNLHIPSNALLFSVVAGISYVSAYSKRRSL